MLLPSKQTRRVRVTLPAPTNYHMWILTREINQYDQDGEYFVAAWTVKPTETQIEKCVYNANNDLLHHILNGGGRLKYEYEWYNLFEHKEIN